MCVCVIITKAVCLVGNEGLAGGGYLLFSTQYGFDDEVLHLSHQHWNRDNWDICSISNHTYPECPLLRIMVEILNVDDTQFLPIAEVGTNRLVEMVTGEPGAASINIS